MPKFKIRLSYSDDGPHVFFVNGVEVGSCDYDNHGSQGMGDMQDMFRNIAAQVGAEVLTEYKE